MTELERDADGLMMRWKTICVGVILLGLSASGVSQVVASKDTPSAALEGMLAPLEDSLMKSVLSMPADKYGFAPSAAIFVPTQEIAYPVTRSFGSTVAHVAQLNYLFYAAASGLKPDRDVPAIARLAGKEDVVAALTDSFAFAHRAIAMITTANAFDQVAPVSGQKTRIALAAFAVAHGYEHFGQLGEYLRMNGITPAGAKK